jgi:hypothetical protein
MRTLIVAVFALSLTLACYAGPVTVTNGGFEDQTFAGWTQSGNTDFTGVICASGAQAGSCYGNFGPVGSLGYIAQDLATTPGDLYDVTFWLRGSGTYNEFQLIWGGNLVYDAVNVSLADWTPITVSGLAGTGSTELRFGLRNDPAFLYLDSISVATSASVPEPSTILMLAAGALLIGVRRLF